MKNAVPVPVPSPAIAEKLGAILAEKPKPVRGLRLCFAPALRGGMNDRHQQRNCDSECFRILVNSWSNAALPSSSANVRGAFSR